MMNDFFFYYDLNSTEKYCKIKIKNNINKNLK